jgi:hypothetical protein
MVKLRARKIAVPRMLFASDHGSTVPLCARLKVIAIMIQPIVSSTIAAETTICPTFLRMNLISRTTIATIFTEEIESAVPRKSEVMSRASGCGRR